MKKTLRFFGFLGCVALGCLLPTIIWSITWVDLIQILSATYSQDGKKLELISQITKEFGLTQTSIREWALQKIFISLGIAIGVFIIILILTSFIKDSKNKDTRIT